jgi:hypothetical protein
MIMIDIQEIKTNFIQVFYSVFKLDFKRFF